MNKRVANKILKRGSSFYPIVTKKKVTRYLDQKIKKMYAKARYDPELRYRIIKGFDQLLKLVD